MIPTHQLRSFIAPAAPATRARCEGTEPDMRVEFGFTPRWYRERLGIDFGERWHTDPAYRQQTLVRMRAELNRRFPQLRLSRDASDDCMGTLNGAYGACVVAMLFGVPTVYYPDNWPASVHKHLTRQEVAKLEPPDLNRSPVFEAIMRQMDWLEAEYGRIEGFLNWQGVLNNALRLRGYEILSDMAEDPACARHLFAVIAHTMIEGAQRVYARQRASGVIIEHFSVSNCFVNMVSAAMYREQLLPFDRLISDTFPYFGVHNCAWNVDPYVEAYASIRTLGYIDGGLESDLRRVKRLCPDTRRAVMYKPTDLANKPLETIEQDLRQIRLELSPCDIVMADIDHETPDERVLAFAELAEKTLHIDPLG